MVGAIPFGLAIDGTTIAALSTLFAIRLHSHLTHLYFLTRPPRQYHHTAATVNASPLASRRIWSRSLRPTASRPSSRTLAHRSACPARRSRPSWPRPAPPTGRRSLPTRWPSSYRQEWEHKAVFRSPLFSEGDDFLHIHTHFLRGLERTRMHLSSATCLLCRCTNCYKSAVHEGQWIIVRHFRFIARTAHRPHSFPRAKERANFST